MASSLTCLARRTFDPAALLAAHPPALRHPNKRLAFELACPPGAAHAGAIEVTRWGAAPLPARVALAATACAPVEGFYDYAGPTDGVWHVNFADPELFYAYGSALLAQDELQAVEHPLLGPVREALLDDGHARTEDAAAMTPTPVLVAGVERRCTLDTAPAPGRPHGLYGNRFAAAPADAIRAALHVHAAPRPSNLIAIAAPVGGRGAYTRAQLERILVAAYTGFAAAREESRRRWPSAPVEVRTGFWGCGAFGGNRHAMTALQLLAARLAGVDRVQLHAADRAGVDDLGRGAADLAADVAAGAPGEPLAALLARVEARRYPWGVSNGT